MAFLIISSLLILVQLSVRVNTDESNLDCFPSIMVPRNMVWRARVMDILMINCTVVSEVHCWKNIEVSWCRITEINECRHFHSKHTITGWKSITESKRLLFLIFWKISFQDAGLYRCEMISPTSSMSHAINVTVTDIHTDCDVVSTETITAGTPAVTVPVTDITHTHLIGEKWFYVICFSVFGVALFLAVLLIMSRGLKKFLEDEVTMTTVTYEETEKSSVQD
ncbi:uncharacterized protein LOC131363839 [Hemibagrus wyckioides]|uniref:uncharacterized protein LOC131363839 n=1 Tax=Hemibagrus wyckioides TaxID=337641 RepID=UPI00266C95E5|nr:uncharacterized protein LOC131363839 [Hemibagrus wyckioides]